MQISQTPVQMSLAAASTIGGTKNAVGMSVNRKANELDHQQAELLKLGMRAKHPTLQKFRESWSRCRKEGLSPSYRRTLFKGLFARRIELSVAFTEAYHV